MLCLNLLATFLEDSAPVSSQSIRCVCLRKGNLYQSLFQAICSGISSICGSITYCLVNIRWETSSKTWTALNSLILPGFSSTCSAEVLYSSAISSQEPFISPMSAQVFLQLVLLGSFSHWVAPVWSAFPFKFICFVCSGILLEKLAITVVDVWDSGKEVIGLIHSLEDEQFKSCNSLSFPIQ